MIIDAAWKFSANQAITAAAASTSTVDLGVARDAGAGQTVYVVVHVKEAFTDGGSNTGLQISIEGDSTSTFTPDGTLVIGTLPKNAAIGDEVIYSLSPGAAPLQYRYLQLKYTPTGADLTGGKVDAFLTLGINRAPIYAKNYAIS